MTRNVVVCPNCDGKPVCNPFEQKADRVCSTCNGRGLVNLAKYCGCGRPAVMLVADVVVCTTTTCHQEALKSKSTQVTVTDAELEAAVNGLLSDGWLGL
jgi:hypothetical protein